MRFVMTEAMSSTNGGPALDAPGDVPPLEALGLEKNFIGGDGSRLHILRGIDLSIGRGEAIAIT